MVLFIFAMTLRPKQEATKGSDRGACAWSAMALYRYLRPLNEGSNPHGPLSFTASPFAIKDANTAVKKGGESSVERKEAYAKFTPDTQTSFAKYASLHGNKATIRRFTKQLGKEI